MILGVYLIMAGVALAACELVLLKGLRHCDSGAAIIAFVIIMVFDAVFSSWLFAGGVAMCLNCIRFGGSRRRNRK